MSKFLKKALISSLSVSLLGLAWGCGGSSNNDQGTSVQNLGYFQANSSEDPPPGETGAIIPLSTEVAVGGVDGLFHITAMGVFNRMQDQFFRIVRFDCTYDVPGSSPSLVIPSDSENVSFIVNPATYSEDNPLGAVAEDSTDNLPNFVYAGFEILSPDLYAFLNANRASLPELPFRMTATCRAVGVTQSGSTLATNDMTYQIQFVELTECCQGTSDADGNLVPGYPIGTGTGGSTDGNIVTGGSGSAGSLTTSGTTLTGSGDGTDTAATP